MNPVKLKLGIPKGSLQESTIKMFDKAGFKISVSERSYFPTIDDEEIELIMLRAQEMSKYVEAGVLDCGITGGDWVLENSSDVKEVADLLYAKSGLRKVRWVLAVSEDSKIRSVKDLEGKRIATELVSVTKKYLKENKVTALVEFSWGATEAKVTTGLVDAIVELTETGSSLRANKLKIVETIAESVTKLIANKISYEDKTKREKIENIALLLKGALKSEGMVGLKMNVKKNDLAKVLKVLPALMRPTVANLSDDEWCDVDTVIEEKIVRVLIPELKKAGAQGIVEYPLNKVIE
ncbi:MAG: ATP phosphoribosyltransferase [Candidatus Omnitrophica bacterium]|nr:ATP phosphoribosyltransferase [Candidatus Omnitrophota bacterium]MCG2705279.1 ATP phosphoribosyltransferase [Candidatus Omnitrophota bacterium]